MRPKHFRSTRSRGRELELPIPTKEFSASLLKWYAGSRRDLPWRDSSDPYRIWVSEVMLQQTRVKAVLPYFEEFIRVFPSPEALASAEEEAVLKIWSGLGYYQRARNLMQAARILRDHHSGKFPEEPDQAMSLPGVGRYTAGAVLSIAYGKPLPVADGNVKRLLIRYLGLQEVVGSGLDSRLWNLLEEMVREPAVAGSIGDFNQALMELGATVCTPRKPDCRSCPLVPECRACRLEIQDLLPRVPEKRKPIQLHYTVLLVSQGTEYLLRRNSGRQFLHGLWEFPMLEGKPSECMNRSLLECSGTRFVAHRLHVCVRHQITFRKLQLHPVTCAPVDPLPEGPDWTWSRLDPPRVPVPAFVLKIMRSIGAARQPAAGGNR